MGTPFKMKGFSGFVNSPMKQDKKRKVTPGEKVKPKFRLSVGTLADGTKEYFKIDSEGNKTKISESTYNSLKS